MVTDWLSADGPNAMGLRKDEVLKTLQFPGFGFAQAPNETMKLRGAVEVQPVLPHATSVIENNNKSARLALDNVTSRTLNAARYPNHILIFIIGLLAGAIGPQPFH